MEQTIMRYEFVLIFFACFITFLLISIFVKQKSIRILSMLLFSIFIMFSLFELALSIFCNKNKIEYDYNCFNKIMKAEIQIDRDVQFFDRNNNKRKVRAIKDEFDLNNYDYYKIIYDATYSVYNNFRLTKGNTNSTETYIFLCCSFTFGDGLNDDETLPYYFSKLYNFEKNILNCGYQGRSSNTALNILNRKDFQLLPINKNPKIEHCFYSLIEEHIHRNFRFYNPGDVMKYENEKWFVNKQPYGLLKKLFVKNYFFRKVFLPMIDGHNKQYYEDYIIKSLEEMNGVVEEKYNSKLTIIVWPDEKYDEIFIEKLKETNLDLIFLPEYFILEEKYAIKYDGHPSAKANEEIAKILYNHINEKDKIN